MNEMCIICRHPKTVHSRGLVGDALICPPRVTYFEPCKHLRKQGSGCITSGGGGWGEDTCMDCFERFSWGTPPNSGGTEHE